ncbi:hypothetical protein AB1K32_25370 [Metabacillus dongyingensis]|uniref:hypothetical protein n=1 Tax=Metabacillus dongyingensis TaxID=2874282 RepID=UPI003B8B533F
MNKKDHALYSRWKSIMDRCYRSKNKNYRFYGAKGIKVSDTWHHFWNFVYDVDNHLIDGHLLYEKGWQLDKDIKGGKIYSLENCTVISGEDNRKIANNKLSKKIIASKNNKQIEFESISEAGRNLNIKRTNIRYFLRSGNADRTTGYSFKYYV